ncbi:MAG: amino acid permease [Bryobacteraceae bacterium]
MTYGRDADDLNRFGYAQELLRSMGGFSNFAISFSIISILTGTVTLFGYGLEMGGPLEMSLGWPIATLFMLLVAASMAELCSAYPTSGAMYHWASALGGPGWGWFCALLNLIGLIAALSGIDYSCAQFVLPFAGLPTTPANLFLAFAAILLTQGVLNHFGVRLIAILNDLSVVVHIAGLAAVVCAVFWLAPLQPISFLSRAINSNGRSPYVWAFLLGLLQAHWTYTGFDGSAHMAEETEDPRRRAPWGIVLSVAVSGIAGYLLVIALTLATRDISGVLQAKDTRGNPVPAAVAILQFALGVRFGNALSALASVAMWFCGLACITSASRAVYALARDNGMPAAAVFRKIDTRHGTPGPAIWGIVGSALIAMAWSGAVPIVTSLSTISLYGAYIIPIALGMRARWTQPEWTRAAVWNLGRYGAAVNAIAIVYTVFIAFVLSMPPNELAGKTFLGVVAGLAALYFLVVRPRFHGPEFGRPGHPNLSGKADAHL